MNSTKRQQQMAISILQGNNSLKALRQQERFSGLTARTLQRDLGSLIDAGFIERSGGSRSTVYSVLPAGRLAIALEKTVLEEMLTDDNRPTYSYDFSRLDTLNGQRLFSNSELDKLSSLQKTFSSHHKSLPSDIARREWERITIELAWKSSAFEGNTYSLLETETLIKQGFEATGKTAFEAHMIIDHKNALDFANDSPELFNKDMTVGTIVELHRILVKDLGIDHGLRKRRVAITGSTFLPLDNGHQIMEEIEKFCEVINSKESIFEKALMAFFYIPYLQPFNDGNKRTGRILANALLRSADAFPVALRGIDVNTYKLAMLAYYELGVLGNLKDAFFAQAEYSLKNYSLG